MFWFGAGTTYQHHHTLPLNSHTSPALVWTASACCTTVPQQAATTEPIARGLGQLLIPFVAVFGDPLSCRALRRAPACCGGCSRNFCGQLIIFVAPHSTHTDGRLLLYKQHVERLRTEFVILRQVCEGCCRFSGRRRACMSFEPKFLWRSSRSSHV